MMTRTASHVRSFALTATIGATACAGVKVPVATTAPAPAGASLWVEPTDSRGRDLFYGPWGSEHAPDPKGVYTLVERKHAGVNLGLTVKDEQGPRMEREATVSRRPRSGRSGRSRGVAAAFRGRLSPAAGLLPAGLHGEGRLRQERRSRRPLPLEGPVAERCRLSGSGKRIPFVGSKPYQGLIVLLMMFNSTDLKNSNNTLYEHRNGDLVEQWYVARDLGAALGDANPLAPRKNHPESFEKSAVHPRRQQRQGRVRVFRLVQEPGPRSHHAGRSGVGQRSARTPVRQAVGGCVPRRRLSIRTTRTASSPS